ncbi:MAG: hypothetical protein IKK61_04205 [Clostridia bacterium]|nr:hypothetical protein [Clostridia bacterium]
MIKESGFGFCFSQGSAIKFDDTPYYRKCFVSFPAAKGVDILYKDQGQLVLLEIKNCKGHEADNRWRIDPDNKKAHLAPEDSHDRDSLDIEIAQKVAMTIACLIGAVTTGVENGAANSIIPYANMLVDKGISTKEKNLLIILLLEGDFGGRTRTKKMQMESLQVSLRKKLRWLNCTVSVVDSNTYNKKLFTLLDDPPKTL